MRIGVQYGGFLAQSAPRRALGEGSIDVADLIKLCESVFRR